MFTWVKIQKQVCIVWRDVVLLFDFRWARRDQPQNKCATSALPKTRWSALNLCEVKATDQLRYVAVLNSE